jgi:hypothetical protein
MAKDLRSFIAQVEARHPEEIARVTKPISPLRDHGAADSARKS